MSYMVQAIIQMLTTQLRPNQEPIKSQFDHISAQEQARELGVGLKEAEWTHLYPTKQK